MGETIGKLRRMSETEIGFRCPGCDEAHVISIAPGRWTWNGNCGAPTFFPSILARSGHYAGGWSKEACWCTYNAEHADDPAGFTCGICHSYVTDGKIQFLTDSTHALSGQTVEIPNWE